MAKERPKQLELFTPDENSEHLIAKPVDTGFLDYIKLYEKAILVIIGFMITGIVAFCCGFENGKSRAVSATNSRFDVAGQKSIREPAVAFSGKKDISSAGFTIKGQLKNTPVKQEIILQESSGAPSDDAYTVQIGSYQSRSGAEAEMAKLRKKGLTTIVLKKGSYNVVCVGTFNNKETARSLLTQLKSKYRDCCIRRL